MQKKQRFLEAFLALVEAAWGHFDITFWGTGCIVECAVRARGCRCDLATSLGPLFTCAEAVSPQEALSKWWCDLSG